MISRVMLLLIALFFFCQNASAQPIRTVKDSPHTLFLHCDKTLYTNNETIWFTAYLSSKDKQIAKHDILSVFLQLEGSNKIVVSEQYFMESGFAFGSIELPDTIPPGNYKLIAYTNVVNAKALPSVTFTQSLTIKTTAQQKFSAEFQILPLIKNASTLDVFIKVKGLPIQKNGKYPSADIRYYLKDKAQIAETKEDGTLLIKVPVNDIDALRNKFYAEVKFYDEIKHLSAVLPTLLEQRVDLKFYPEGGQLSDQIKSVIGIEALGHGGQPISFKGIVYEESIPVDTIETNATGFAKIALAPKQGADYYVKPFDESSYTNGLRFNFPAVKKDYPVITMPKAIADDSLSFVLRSKNLAEFNVVVHQGSEVFLDFKVTANAKGRPVKIPLIGIPTGITSLTILGETGLPLAERLFFAHYQRKNRLSVVTNKQEFAKREKVIVKLKLEADKVLDDSLPMVSVACVLSSRLESLKFQDIEHYSYVTARLEDGAFSMLGKTYGGDDYLESVLLIKGWRKFKDSLPDTNPSLSPLEFTGNLLKNGRKVTEPISFTVLRDSAFSLQSTDHTGFFKMETQNLLHGYGRKMMFSVNMPNRELYTVNLLNPFERTDSLLASVHSANELTAFKNVVSSEAFVYDNKALKLKEVEIRGKRGNQDFGKSAKNECGDYVCSIGILNCAYDGDKSIGAYPPVLGQRYKVPVRSLNGYYTYERRIYKGCVSKSKVAGTFQGVSYAREFYLNDYTDKNLPAVDNQSTIYWNHAIELNSKDTEFSFYTSDLPGMFRIVVQGMSASGPVFATKEIKVN
ncbi:MAG: hypothetical protein EOO07_01340 [Chitinophagaceae bacterium]|nr:MAG: hypothetical protein EOO07_01340 [Chitinophagaceae bacterium]